MSSIVATKKSQFEKRKRDHIKVALLSSAQSKRSSGFDSIQLIHEALPECDLSEVSITTKFKNTPLSAPFFISSMTAGHRDGEKINYLLSQLSHTKQILMGVGSQRKELSDETASSEWRKIRKKFPKALWLANLGLPQVIESGVEEIQRLIDSTEALGLFIHLNPLQECLQEEGTPNFKNGLKKIEVVAKKLQVPVIVKETGCGVSQGTFKRLNETGVFAVDVGGNGGTHWGQVEKIRRNAKDWKRTASEVFDGWGISTVDSLIESQNKKWNFEVWASGGVRSGVDIAKALSLGASKVGLALPWLQAAMDKQAEEKLNSLYEMLCWQLKVSLFCSGVQHFEQEEFKKRWLHG